MITDLPTAIYHSNKRLTLYFDFSVWTVISYLKHYLISHLPTIKLLILEAASAMLCRGNKGIRLRHAGLCSAMSNINQDQGVSNHALTFVIFE